MDFNLRHPSEQLVAIMRRIYDRDMTTLSGGNLSIRDEEGTIWITPAGMDKGHLTPADIIRVAPDGGVHGPHRPSSELPFHRRIYAARPDLRAVVHAHAPALVTFSIAGQIPDPQILPQAAEVCGPIRYAPYAMTGSEALGVQIAETFATGVNIVMLENHGVAIGGLTLLEAFERLETLEYCARTLIHARKLGTCRALDEGQVRAYTHRTSEPAPFRPVHHSPLERGLRQEMVEIVHRAYERQLMTSIVGVVSVRVDADRFLITPKSVDRQALAIEDIVLIEGGRREEGLSPSRQAELHSEIYRQHPEVGSIITAQSPCATAYAVTSAKFDSRTIPESYIFLRDVPTLSYDLAVRAGSALARAITDRSPVLLIENFGALTTGANLLEAYDRLEVLENTARSLLQLPNPDALRAIGEGELRAIEEKFFKN